jgi:hypothetical protein
MNFPPVAEGQQQQQSSLRPFVPDLQLKDFRLRQSPGLPAGENGAAGED